MTCEISKTLKIKLLLLAIISIIGFSYLVMPFNASISVPIFTLVQFGCFCFVVQNKKRLILFIPIFIMSLNSFISANTIWKLSNLVLCAVLYSAMFADFDFKSDSLEYLTRIIFNFFSAFSHFFTPFKWIFEFSGEKTSVIKKVIKALLIAMPCAFFLILVLANADMVFSIKISDGVISILKYINFNTMYNILCGIIAGLFIFGIVFHSYVGEKNDEFDEFSANGDLIIINVILSVILAVYTFFVVIQFKYLFAESVLPNGLTYTEYARKGFFELLALTGVNIVIILAVVKLTKNKDGKWMLLTKILCHYLCAVTVVLLVSSFYRMYLYVASDGLTRLRFFVLGFLVFEAIGLAATFIYISKPKFNITLLYAIIALTYYSVLNLVPTDYIIAKNQIDRYLKGEAKNLEYVFTLSPDAAPAMEYLLKKTDNDYFKDSVEIFLKGNNEMYFSTNWQSYNLSVEKMKSISK